MRYKFKHFYPMLESLERRDTPAVTITPFASQTGGVADSYFIKGTSQADLIQIRDDPGGGTPFQVTANNVILTLPTIANAGNPVIVRLSLLAGNDSVEYEVPNNVQLIRKIEYTGGTGTNKFFFSNGSGTGVNLATDSVVGIVYDGTQGRVSDFDVSISSMDNLVLDLDLAFGAGNDKGIDIVIADYDPLANADSSISAVIDLGNGSNGSMMNPANQLLIALAGNIGDADSIGTVVDFSVLGGAKADAVTVVNNIAQLGSGTGHTDVNFDVNLGGGPDSFQMLQVGASTYQSRTTMTATVHGGSGNDILNFFNTQFFMGGLLNLSTGALLDVNLLGDSGNDTIRVQTDIVGGSLAFGIVAEFRTRVNGGTGNDTILVQLNNTAGSPLGVYDVQATGSSGNDAMQMGIADPVGMIYFAGAAILDGGLGTNTLTSPSIGNVVELNL